MTISERGSPYESMKWSNCAIQEKKTTSSSEEEPQSFYPALDCLNTKRPINLVFKTRVAKTSSHMMHRHHDADLLQSNKTKSTTRTQSFTTHSSDFLPEERIEEEVTITDDGPVIQDNLKQEQVYKKLRELTIVPPVENVPKFVSTPERGKKKNTTPATSTSSSPSHTETPTTVDLLPEGAEDSSSDSDSVLSDISGLTGICTRLSILADSQVPQQVYREEQPSLVPMLPCEREFTTPSLLTKSLMKTQAARPRARNQVSFSKVCIREYERILGDNPSCSCGPSISIGWNFDEEEILSIDEWEGWRETEREPDRLVLCREEREDILLDLGYSQKEIAQAVREINKAKNKRRQTIQNLSASGVEELVESAGKKVKSVVKVKNLFGRKKKTMARVGGDDEESVCA